MAKHKTKTKTDRSNTKVRKVIVSRARKSSAQNFVVELTSNYGSLHEDKKMFSSLSEASTFATKWVGTNTARKAKLTTFNNSGKFQGEMIFGSKQTTSFSWTKL